MKITIEITCDNAVFGYSPATEVSRILLDYAMLIERGENLVEKPLVDLNGNKVGSVTVSDAEEPTP